MRWVLIIILVLLGFSAGPSLATSSEPRPIVIKMDMGGWIPNYIQRAERYAREGRRIIIDGDCRSACTFFLWSKYKLDICVTRNARLMFHKPLWRTGPGRFDVESTPQRVEWSNRRWAAIVPNYPPAIARLVRNAPNPSEIKDAHIYKILSGQNLTGVVRRCDTK